jgi:hypothetical protein
MSKYQHPNRSHERTYDSARHSFDRTWTPATKAVSATTTVLSETSVLVLAIMVVVTLRTHNYPLSFKYIYRQSTHVTNVVDPSSADLSSVVR